jgi:hypothetical protein
MIDYDTFNYFKKLKKYYRLRNKFKRRSVRHLNNNFKIKKKIKKIKKLKNQIPLLFQNERFFNRLSQLMPESDFKPKSINIIGLWPTSAAKPLAMPDILENKSLISLLDARKNRTHRKLKDYFSVLNRNEANLFDEFNRKLKPNLFINSKLNKFFDNQIETVRYLPKGRVSSIDKLPNLKEYNITPTKITEQF